MSAPILIDGGFSTQLSKHIKERIDGHPLWTARFLVTDKQSCVLAHRDFIKAGAKVIRTNTYQAFEEGFVQYMGLSEERSLDPVKDAVELCREAIRLELTDDVLIGGSVGPIGAWRGDGSEYTGNYCNDVTTEEFISMHRPRVAALIEAGVDILCFETIPCASEAFALIDLLQQYPEANAWISFSARSGEEISNGDKFAETAVKCWEKGGDRLVAVGVNCGDPSYVTPLFTSLKRLHPNLPFIAYPNSGHKYDMKKKRWVQGERGKMLIDYLPEWLEMGILYVGGCCQNSSEEISKIDQCIKKWHSKS